MTIRTLQVVAIIAALALVGTVTFAVVAAGEDNDGQDGGFFRHIHELGQRLHGGGHHQDPMGQLIEQLELTPDQMQRFEKVHEIMGDFGHGGDKAMIELHDSLVTQFEQGDVGTAEIRRAIDGHLKEFRGMAYSVTDELVGLINELDQNQRGILLKHLEGTKSGNHGHGH